MNYSSDRVNKIKNSDEELIIINIEHLMKLQKKRSGFNYKTPILDKENITRHIIIIKSKTLLFALLLYFLIFSFIFFTFFICLIIMDKIKIKDFLKIFLIFQILLNEIFIYFK